MNLKKALEVWEQVKSLKIAELIREVDMVWNIRSIEKLISELLHNPYVSLETQDIETIVRNEFLNFNFTIGGTSLFCSFVERDGFLRLSSNVDIEINGKGLDYAYENINMEYPTLCLLYMKAGKVATRI